MQSLVKKIVLTANIVVVVSTSSYVSTDANESPILTARQFKEQFDRQERGNIQAVLRASRNKMEAAKRFGVRPSTMHSMMKRSGLYTT